LSDVQNDPGATILEVSFKKALVYIEVPESAEPNTNLHNNMYLDKLCVGGWVVDLQKI
jgi:hypothetical protein